MTTISNKTELETFYHEVVTQVPLLDENGEQVYETVTETITLFDGTESKVNTKVYKFTEESHKELNTRPRYVDEARLRATASKAWVKLADIVLDNMQWQWFDSYKAWEAREPQQSTPEYIEVVNDDGTKSTVEVETTYESDLTKWQEEEPNYVERITAEEYLTNIGLMKEMAKQLRTNTVAALMVEVDGLVFDGDETSQNRMARAVAAGANGDTIQWVLADNTIKEVTHAQIKQALYKAGVAQTEAWVTPVSVSDL